LRLAELLGADSVLSAGALTWTALVVAAAGAWLAFARDSAVCLLIAAIAAGITVLAAVQWIFGSAGQGRARVLVLVLALVAVLAMADLGAFVAVVGISPAATLLWWPLLLIVLGLVAVGAGLRPRAPLPPEPDPYRAGEQPLSMRTDEEITLRVRDDSPPRD